MLFATDHNYGITVLRNYGFTVRLPPKKLENQKFPLLKLRFLLKQKHYPHIQLPSWTRVPEEPLNSLSLKE